MAGRIIILGAGIMQGPAIRIAREMGLETVVVDANPLAPHVKDADRFACIDLKDKEGIAALGASLRKSGGLSGIMTVGTDFSASVAWAAERLGLPGIPYEVALDASDKERMRGRFAAAGVPSPPFTVLNEAPPASFSPPFPYPVVVKPVDNMGARGCRRVDGQRELGRAVNGALGFSRSRRAIVESCMDGPEFSVDALVYEGEICITGLADRHIYFPPYFIEMGHTMPTDLESGAAEELLAVFKRGVRALGITMGAAKGDIKLTARGPMIGEIAARLSGGYMSGWTYPLSSGVEPVRGAIEIALGRRPSGLTPRRAWTSAERAVISLPGRVKSIVRGPARKDAPLLFLRVEEGSEVRFPENNVSKAGNVIAAAESRKEAIARAEEAARSVLIRLETRNAETDAFLAGAVSAAPGGAESGVSRFPPDAFTLQNELRTRLEALPGVWPEFEGPEEGRDGKPLSVIPFPEFTRSGLLDYTGRSVAASLEAVRELCGLPLPLGGEGRVLGRRFWEALVRGGYQGAAYVVDGLFEELKERGL